MKDTASIAKAALLGKFSGATDKKGYTHWLQENLLTGIDLVNVEDDLRGGDGDESFESFKKPRPSIVPAKAQKRSKSFSF